MSGSGELFSGRWALLLLCGLAEELVEGGGLGERFRILFNWREASVDSGGSREESVDTANLTVGKRQGVSQRWLTLKDVDSGKKTTSMQ